MATKTTRYQLIKPDQDDFYNVDDFNTNADTIDDKLGEHEDKSVVSEDGAHDIRFYNNKLSVRDNGVWRDAQIFATVRVAVPSGAVVKATHDNHTRVAIAVDGYAYIEVNYRGLWTFVATYQTGVSETVTKDIQSNDDVDITLKFATVLIIAKSSSTLTLTHTDGTVITRQYTIDDENETVYLPKLGTWSARLDWMGFHFDKTTNVTNYTQYTYGLNYRVFGIRINEADSNPETRCSQLYETSMYTKGNWTSWKQSVIFKNWQPIGYNESGKITPLSWDNYAVQQSDKKGYDPDYNVDITYKDEVYILIPKMGLRITKSGNYVDVLLTNYQEGQDQGFTYNAFSKDSEGDCSAVAVGAYLATLMGDNITWRTVSGGLYSDSKSLNLPYNLINVAAKRIHSNGIAYNWAIHTYIQACYLIVYQCTHSQFGILYGDHHLIEYRKGWSNTSGAIASDLKFDATTKIFGIEGLVSCYNTWIDNIYLSGNTLMYRRWYGDPWKKYDTIKCVNNSYTTRVAGDNIAGFLPVVGGGSNTTYYADLSSIYSGKRFMLGIDNKTTVSSIISSPGALGIYHVSAAYTTERPTYGGVRLCMMLTKTEWNGW